MYGPRTLPLGREQKCLPIGKPRVSSDGATTYLKARLMHVHFGNRLKGENGRTIDKSSNHAARRFSGASRFNVRRTVYDAFPWLSK